MMFADVVGCRLEATQAMLVRKGQQVPRAERTRPSALPTS